MSVEDVQRAVAEAERLIEEALAVMAAMPAQFDTAVAGLAAMLRSSARMESQAAQGTLREAAERVAEARSAAHAATEVAARYVAGL